METEAPASRSSRPRPILLILLGLAVAAFAFVKLMPSGSATRSPGASNQPRVAPTAAAGESVDPQDFDVRLSALNDPRPKPSDAQRNPFTFAPTAPASPPPGPPKPINPTPTPVPPFNGEQKPLGPPEPPPIPLKFMGLVEVEGKGRKFAALTDCKFVYTGQEGEIIDGRYRLVKIGVESVEMEYVNGCGRTKIRLSGDCPGR